MAATCKPVLDARPTGPRAGGGNSGSKMRLTHGSHSAAQVDAAHTRTRTLRLPCSPRLQNALTALVSRGSRRSVLASAHDAELSAVAIMCMQRTSSSPRRLAVVSPLLPPLRWILSVSLARSQRGTVVGSRVPVPVCPAPCSLPLPLPLCVPSCVRLQPPPFRSLARQHAEPGASVAWEGAESAGTRGERGSGRGMGRETGDERRSREGGTRSSSGLHTAVNASRSSVVDM